MKAEIKIHADLDDTQAKHLITRIEETAAGMGVATQIAATEDIDNGLSMDLTERRELIARIKQWESLLTDKTLTPMDRLLLVQAVRGGKDWGYTIGE